jgi:hypothetical protein
MRWASRFSGATDRSFMQLDAITHVVISCFCSLTLLFNTENVYLELENEGKFVILMLAL